MNHEPPYSDQPPHAIAPANLTHTLDSAMDLTNDSVQTPSSSVVKIRGRPKGSKNREPDPNSKNAIIASKFLENVVLPPNYTPPTNPWKKRTSEGLKVSRKEKHAAATYGEQSASKSNTRKGSAKDKPAVATVGQPSTSTSNTPKGLKDDKPAGATGGGKIGTPKVPKNAKPAAAMTGGQQSTSASITPKVLKKDKPTAGEQSTSASNTPKVPRKDKPAAATEGLKSTSASITPKVQKKDKPTAAPGGQQSTSASNTPKKGRGRPPKDGSITTPQQKTKGGPNTPKRGRGRPRKDGLLGASQKKRKESPITQGTEPPQKKMKASSKEKENPGAAFRRFKKLPKEVQSLIWEFALAEAPTIVEATYNRDSSRFEISGPASGIISVCGSANIPKYFKPIYLPAQEQKSTVAPVFIRPKQDILYIPSLGRLDVSFLFFPENQVLRQLGLAQPEIYLFFGNKPDSLSMVKALKLETLYILEGRVNGAESNVNRNNKYEIELVEMQQGPAEQDASAWWEPGDATPPPASWTSGEFEEMRNSVIVNLKRAKGGIHVPEVVGKEVKRTVIPETGNVT
jgi:hypothetical protein